MAGNVVSNVKKYYGGQVPVPGHNIIIDSPDESIKVDPHVDPDTGALVYSLSTNIVEMTTDEVTEVTNDLIIKPRSKKDGSI